MGAINTTLYESSISMNRIFASGTEIIMNVNDRPLKNLLNGRYLLSEAYVKGKIDLESSAYMFEKYNQKIKQYLNIA